MKNRFIGFGELLTQGIESIQKAESQDRKKRISEIEAELAKTIGRQVSTIQWFRKGNIPTTQVEKEEIARIIFRRGKMSVEWLEQFLKSVGHPNWTALRDELIPVPPVVGGQNSGLYKRLKMTLRREVFLDGSSQTSHETEIEVISDTPLSVIRHRVTNSANAIGNYKLELNETRRDDAGKITTRIVTKNESIYTSLVEFTPPLLRNRRAYYSYTTSSSGSLSLTYEEVHRQYLEGLRKGDFEGWGVNITAQTEQLDILISFPPKYPISLPITAGFGVYQGLNDVLDEKTRIISAAGFRATETDHWSLALSVRDAKIGYYYELQWIPPSESTLKSIVSNNK